MRKGLKIADGSIHYTLWKLNDYDSLYEFSLSINPALLTMIQTMMIVSNMCELG